MEELVNNRKAIDKQDNPLELSRSAGWAASLPKNKNKNKNKILSLKTSRHRFISRRGVERKSCRQLFPSSHFCLYVVFQYQCGSLYSEFVKQSACTASARFLVAVRRSSSSTPPSAILEIRLTRLNVAAFLILSGGFRKLDNHITLQQHICCLAAERFLQNEQTTPPPQHQKLVCYQARYIGSISPQLGRRSRAKAIS